MFQKLDELLGKLNEYRPLAEGEIRRLRDEFLIDFTYNSNAIEGNTLTLQETALVLQEGITIDKKPLKEHLEAIGHREAFFYIEELVKQEMSLSENIIRDVYSIVLMDKPRERGKYRRIPVTILGVAHKPPQPYLVPGLMEQLINKYNEEMEEKHIIERTALFHLQFESIHPFVDGNGRTGRLIMNFELMKEGYPPINIKFKDRKRYYNSFVDFHLNKSNPRMLTEMIKDYVEEELTSYIKILEVANSPEIN
ncbi:MAG: Fic family protein [Tissierellia bacterium]|nr:Fic family protein [Tissierellia bacterium]